ncbi:MAG TPA: DUF1549 domain-containing protein, partial [Verrucomicrobia bacterium]|nr:DUF1549 domain-containing protein [Verrucomicrobiota bacterium]
LEKKSIWFSVAAEPETLLRRVYLDLTGLLPESDEIERFLSDQDPSRYSKLIDRLMSSPAYGERWGQFWLDLAGYSDSEGVQHADPIRPHAYRYRDYVIRAFNADKPYDRFLLEQIAGDELTDYEGSGQITEEIYDNLVATGFLRMSADGTFAGITGFLPNRLDVIDDQIRILSSSVMGLSIRCARCHSHKFDPIPQQDYYRLAAIFKGAMDEYDWLRPIKSSVGKARYLNQVLPKEREQWQRNEKEITTQIDLLNEEIEAHKKQEPSEEEKNETDPRIKEIEKTIKQLEANRRPEPLIRALWDRGQPSPTYLLKRGDYRRPTKIVTPGVPSMLTKGKSHFQPSPPWPGAKKTGNRLALAGWLTNPDHPLTARVIVNRLWKHHFGKGLVETLDDFGKAGASPSHPELLDWLARELIRSDWSLKHMHRLMVGSKTYRQSSTATTDEADPDNHLWSRMPLRRMEAEVLRDTLLQIAGRLNRRAYGQPDGISARKDGLVTSNQTNGS